MNAIKNVIVGTAGHIDHGKSSLVEALTGTHPDRLEEEKRRGITIDLGFAFLESNSVRFGFVDVPGHERFVGNMLAGAAGLDLVLLVIAADESIKPQTREHVDICSLLGISRGLIALTKSDLVDRDALDLVRLEIEEYLQGTFLERAPTLPVSVKTGEGLQTLKEELARQAAELRSKSPEGHFRLPIDRSFSIKGFGTVVTGTLMSGTVGAGDEIELFPTGRVLRVRGVQSGGKPIERALAGQRTAVNLAGIEHTSVRRGMQLGIPGRFRATRRIDVRLSLLRTARKLKQHAKVHFHAGAAEVVAEVVLHGSAELLPGESAVAHLRLQEPLLLLPGDRFILREFSPVVTIGGGEILDPFARRPRAKDTGRMDFLRMVESKESDEVVSAIVERAVFGSTFGEIAARTGWTDDVIREAIKKSEARGRVKRVLADPPFLVDQKRYDGVRQQIVESVASFHKANPLSPGMSREDLRARVGRRVHTATFRAALEELAAQKKLEPAGELVRRAGAVVAMQPEEAQCKDQIEAAFEKAGLSVPSVAEVLRGLSIDPKRAEKLLQLLLRDRNLVRISPELIFHKRALAEMAGRLADYKKAKGERISVPAFKELTGISRKYAIPLLEYLDRQRITRRAGDERVIL